MKEYPDKHGNIVKVGDRIVGEGYLHLNGNFKVDLNSVVTAKIINGKMYFGALPAESFYNEEGARFEIIKE